MRWNQQQLNELAKLWQSGRMTYLDIGKRFCVSRCAIAGQIKRLGLAEHREATYDTWTKEDEAIVRQFYPTAIPIEDIIKKLSHGDKPVTVNAVKHKAIAMGLRRYAPRRVFVPIYERGKTMFAKPAEHFKARAAAAQATKSKADTTFGPWKKPEDTGSRNLRLWDLGACQCKFPYGEEDFVFCGAPTEFFGSPWCEAHARIVYPKNRA